VRRHTIPLFGGALIVAPTMESYNAKFAKLAEFEGYKVSDTSDSATRDEDSATCGFVIGNELHVLVVARRAAACHEATHCAQAVALHIGLDPLREQEAFAFLSQWCFDRITGVVA
jgi:hypothetical protein